MFSATVPAALAPPRRARGLGGLAGVRLGSAADPVAAPSALVTRAAFRDALALAAAWKAATRTARPGGGAPPEEAAAARPGPAEPSWHMRMMFAGKYFKVTVGGSLAGGALVFDRGHGLFELGLLFVHPRYQRRGVGRGTLLSIEAACPGAREWLCGLPENDTRSRRFLEALGYRYLGRHQGAPAPGVVSYVRRPFPRALAGS